MAISPATKMAIDSTAANTGRSIKVRDKLMLVEAQQNAVAWTNQRANATSDRTERGQGWVLPRKAAGKAAAAACALACVG